MEVLDTNIIVRYLTQDNPEQAQQAQAAFDEVEAGARTLSLSEGVLVETVQVLSSKRLYSLPRAGIQLHLARLLDLPGIRIANKRTYLRAFDLYVSHLALSFVDCLCLAHAERQGGLAVLSFDRNYDHRSVQADTVIRRVAP